MTSRYANPAIEEIFSDEAKWERWALIEALVYFHIEGGSIAKFDAIMEYAPIRETIEEIEAETNHDVQAFVVGLERYLKTTRGFDMRGVHSRLTSSDLVDTGLALAIGEAVTGPLQASLDELQLLYRSWAKAQADTILDGRTHGRVALPITGEDRWKRMLVDIQTWEPKPFPKGKLGGPVGSSFRLDEVERFVQLIGCNCETGLARQCSSRHALSAFVQRLVGLSGILEAHATNLRLWMIEGVSEYQIQRSDGYVGSSSMPYKNNPTELERVCGMARLVRGYGHAISECCSLWHERDISHSSVERVAIEGIFHCLMQQLTDLRSVISRLAPIPYLPKSIDKANKMAEVKREVDETGCRSESWQAATKSNIA